MNGCGGTPLSAPCMISTHIGSAARAPCSPRPRSRMSSKPTHTPVTRLGVKPTNQASGRLLSRLVVPVLPAAGRPSLPRADAAVPSSITDVIIVGDEVRQLRLERLHRLRRRRRLILAADLLDRAAAPCACRPPRRSHTRWSSRTATPPTCRAPSSGSPRGSTRCRGRARGCATTVGSTPPRVVSTSCDATVLSDSRQRHAQPHRPEELFLLGVLRLPRRQPRRDVGLRPVDQHRRRRPLLGRERRRVDERLERRARLPLGLQRAVEPARPVAVAADDRLDLARRADRSPPTAACGPSSSASIAGLSLG